MKVSTQTKYLKKGTRMDYKNQNKARMEEMFLVS